MGTWLQGHLSPRLPKDSSSFDSISGGAQWLWTQRILSLPGLCVLGARNLIIYPSAICNPTDPSSPLGTHWLWILSWDCHLLKITVILMIICIRNLYILFPIVSFLLETADNLRISILGSLHGSRKPFTGHWGHQQACHLVTIPKLMDWCVTARHTAHQVWCVVRAALIYSAA